MNLYQYCGNNPVNWIDPTGTDRYILTDRVGLHHWIGIDEWKQDRDGKWNKTGRILVGSVYAYSKDGSHTKENYPFGAFYGAPGYYETIADVIDDYFVKIIIKSSLNEDLILMEQLRKDAGYKRNKNMRYGIVTQSYCVPYSYDRLYVGMDPSFFANPNNAPKSRNAHFYNARAQVAFERGQKGKPPREYD